MLLPKINPHVFNFIRLEQLLAQNLIQSIGNLCLMSFNLTQSTSAPVKKSLIFVTLSLMQSSSYLDNDILKDFLDDNLTCAQVVSIQLLLD